jgi:2-polyprenyl-3-methyl-5-hydroxy-6-metoxy-1,4-benzoquinol methylase
MKKIKEILVDLNLINTKTLEVFSNKTRDTNNIKVLRDNTSGVIFLDSFEPDDNIYKDGEYRNEGTHLFGKRDYEIIVDVRRRLQDYEQFYVGKRVIDFGCGEGTFIKEIKMHTQEICGIEIERSYVKHLNEVGLDCQTDINKVKSGSVDTVFCFHTLEHLKEPLEVLRQFYRILTSKGHLIIEVPHANDFLFKHLKSDPFKEFSLWSQHLILHSRISLEKFLRVSGFNDFIIQGKQRYPISNHLNWLRNGKPGGHKSILSSLDNEALSMAYESSLQMLDATDTLVAVVTKG